MSDKVSEAIRLVQSGNKSFFKFIAANETGDTGGHQCGYYIPRDFLSEAFESPCTKGMNQDKIVKIVWNGECKHTTESRFVYYGKGTRDEARITRFEKGFEFLKPKYTGAVILFVKEHEHLFHAFVFNAEEEIDEFFDSLGLGPTNANKLINGESSSPTEQEEKVFADFVSKLSGKIPSTQEMASKAREIEELVYDHVEYVRKDPDRKLVSWMDVEYRLFKAAERRLYGDRISTGFAKTEDFLELANSMLNARKSRAGKSFEHHLSALFTGNDLSFEEQVVTERNKRPDFIFPSSRAYHDPLFSIDKLVFMAAKTTLRDRWTQIIKEADRFNGRTRYLCTLQQGLPSVELDRMRRENVVLVVPKPYFHYYPPAKRAEIMTFEKFIGIVRSTQKEA